MAPSDEIAQLQQIIKKMEKLAIQRARRMAIGFGILAIAGLLTFVYAFVQQVAAEKNAEEALIQHELATQSQRQAERSASEAIKQAAIANELYKALNECRDSKK